MEIKFDRKKLKDDEIKKKMIRKYFHEKKFKFSILQFH
jgi:hypothetical protein